MNKEKSDYKGLNTRQGIELFSAFLGVLTLGLPWYLFVESVDTQGIATGWALIAIGLSIIPYRLLRKIPFIKKRIEGSILSCVITSYLTGLFTPLTIILLFVLLLSIA